MDEPPVVACACGGADARAVLLVPCSTYAPGQVVCQPVFVLVSWCIATTWPVAANVTSRSSEELRVRTNRCIVQYVCGPDKKNHVGD